MVATSQKVAVYFTPFGCDLRGVRGHWYAMKQNALWHALGSAALLGCSAAESDPAPAFGPGPVAPTLPAASSGDTGSSGAASGAIPLGFVEEGAAPVAVASCGGLVVEPERLPLDMYFLVDSSGSMAEPTRSGGSKWDLVTDAMVDFLSSTESAQINAGIGYFPLGATPTCVAGDAGCLAELLHGPGEAQAAFRKCVIRCFQVCSFGVEDNAVKPQDQQFDSHVSLLVWRR